MPEDTETPEPTGDAEVVEQADNPDAVKAALQAERQRAKDAEKRAKVETDARTKLEAELAKFREDAMSESEKAIEAARKEAAEAARSEVMNEFRQERLNTRVEAAATGKFADPKDAAAFLDLSDLDPDDADGIAAEIDRVLEAKPYLKASATQAPGDIDQGARDHNGVTQLTREDLKSMSPEQIVKAKAEGRLDNILTGSH